MNIRGIIDRPEGILHASIGNKPSTVKQLHAGCDCGCNECEDAKDKDKVEAGGPGSGCNGPNCGRPSSGGKSGRSTSKDVSRIAKNAGFKKYSGDEEESVYKHHTTGHTVSIDNKGRWEHISNKEKYTLGKGDTSLAKHLAKISDKLDKPNGRAKTSVGQMPKGGREAISNLKTLIEDQAESIRDEKEGDNDSELISMYKSDSKNFAKAIEHIKSGNLKKLDKMLDRLDSAPRDDIYEAVSHLKYFRDQEEDDF